jgi:transposase
VLAARLYGVGPVTALAMTCWLAGKDRFSSSRQAVRFAGPGRHRLLLGPQGPARAAVPARTAGAALGPLRGRQDPRPVPGPGPRYYAQVKDRCNGKRAALSEARKILRQACHILAELGDDALAPAA